MGATLRVYKRRIRSVTATKKITKAMEMIAASRVVKAQRQVAASTPYATELTRAVGAVAKGSTTQHALTTVQDRLLPLSLEEKAEEQEKKGQLLPLFEFEPSAEDVLDALLPRYVE